MDSVENAMVLYEEQNLAQLKKYKELKQMQETLKKAEGDLKEFLRDEMDRHGLASFKSKDETITITNVAPYSYTTVDVNDIKTRDYDLYEQLVKDYPKFVENSGCVKIKVKDK